MELVEGFFDRWKLVVVQQLFSVWWNPIANRMIQQNVIEDWMVVSVVPVHFLMTSKKNLMRRMMTNFELFFVVWVVFLPLVLRVVFEPVEQSAQLMGVMIVHMFRAVVHQFACEQPFVLQ